MVEVLYLNRVPGLTKEFEVGNGDVKLLVVLAQSLLFPEPRREIPVKDLQ